MDWAMTLARRSDPSLSLLLRHVDIIAFCTVGQVNEFAIVRNCWTEKRYLSSLVHSQIKINCYWIIYERQFNNNFPCLFTNVLEMPDTSFLSNSLGLSRTHLFGRLYVRQNIYRDPWPRKRVSLIISSEAVRTCWGFSVNIVVCHIVSSAGVPIICLSSVHYLSVSYSIHTRCVVTIYWSLSRFTLVHFIIFFKY